MRHLCTTLFVWFYTNSNGYSALNLFSWKVTEERLKLESFASPPNNREGRISQIGERNTTYTTSSFPPYIFRTKNISEKGIITHLGVREMRGLDYFRASHSRDSRSILMCRNSREYSIFDSRGGGGDSLFPCTQKHPF